MTVVAVSGWVLDVAALIAFADRTAYADTMLKTARVRGLTLLVPVTVLADTYAVRREPDARARLAEVRDEQGMWLMSMLATVPEDELTRLTEAASGDRTAAHVAHEASKRHWPVLTDRARALTRLVPGILTVRAGPRAPRGGLADAADTGSA